MKKKEYAFLFLLIIGIVCGCSKSASWTLKKDCLSTTETLPIEYSLIYYRFDKNNYDSFGNSMVVYLDDYDYYNGGSWVSPNGEWVAILSMVENTRQMSLISYSGSMFSFDWDDIWLDYFEWFNNEEIILVDEFGRLVILNPTTGEIDTPEVDLPGYLSDPFPKPHWPYFRYFVPSPDLSHIAYLSFSIESYDDGVSIWNYDSEEVIWERFTGDAFRVRPAWSPDGQYLAIAWQDGNKLDVGYQYHVSIIDKHGNEDHLTGFEEYYQETMIYSRLSWSPDQKYIAMWVEGYSFESGTGIPDLYILDLENKEIIDICVKGPLSGNSPLLWSPNSRYLAVEGADVTVIDISSNSKSVLTEPSRIIGWIKGE